MEWKWSILWEISQNCRSTFSFYNNDFQKFSYFCLERSRDYYSMVVHDKCPTLKDAWNWFNNNEALFHQNFCRNFCVAKSQTSMQTNKHSKSKYCRKKINRNYFWKSCNLDYNSSAWPTIWFIKFFVIGHSSCKTME